MATLVYVCVGEWSGRQWSSVAFIHWRLVAWSLVIGQWRSRISRWLGQWSHSTAEQWTATTTRPHWQKLSSQAAAARAIMLQRTHITTLCCTQQVVVIWRHLSVSSAMSSDCDSSLLTTLTLNVAEIFNTDRLTAFPVGFSPCRRHWMSVQLLSWN